MKLCTVFLFAICLVLGGIYMTQAQSVCIDPGHGGSDPGAVGWGLKEQAINLDVTNRLYTLLKNAGYTVYRTRTSDTDVSLSSRTSYANSVGADRFISIHCNAFNGSANGTETFCYTSGSSTSIRMRDKIQPQLVSALGTYNRGCKTANYYVLKYTNMPAILAELAFIDHQGDAAKLGDAGYRQKAAEAIKRGFEQSRDEERGTAMAPVAFYVAPKFSPDGSKIMTSKAGYHGVYVVTAQGGQLQTLSDESQVGYHARWSGNEQIQYGKASATFQASLDGTVVRATVQEQIKLLVIDGEIWIEVNGERVQLTNGGDIYFNPSLSPDKQQVAYEGLQSGIHVCDLAGNDTVIGRGNHPSWLPDSKGLVFDVSEDNGQEITASVLHMVMLDNVANRIALSAEGLLAQRPNVSLDGSRIVFDAQGKIFLAHLNGSSLANCQELKIVE